MIASLSPTLVSLFLVGRNYFQKYFADSTGNIGLLLATLLLGIFPLLFVSYFWFKPKLVFDKRLNIYRDLKTDVYYCTSCKTKNILSPLAKRESYWNCTLKECRMNFDDPDYVQPENEKHVGPYYG